MSGGRYRHQESHHEKVACNIYRLHRCMPCGNDRFDEERAGRAIRIEESQTSIWISEGQIASETIAIVLLDYTSPNPAPIANIRDVCIVMPDLDEILDTSSELSTTRMWYDDVVDMTLRYPWFEACGNHENIDMQSVVCPSLYAICGEWLEVCNMAKICVAKIEYQ